MQYPKYSIIIPAYNESGRIPATLEAVAKPKPHPTTQLLDILRAKNPDYPTTQRLDASIDVVHKHRMGSCKGRLTATPQGIRYDTTDKGDAFTSPLNSSPISPTHSRSLSLGNAANFMLSLAVVKTQRA